MLIIGLTGGIATGKSTVSKMLSSPPYSLPVVDADLIARQVVSPGASAYAMIVEYFGPSTPDLLVPPSDTMPEDGPDGRGRPLNRHALGRRVFGTDEAAARDRDVLNGIVHPAVRWEMARQVFGWYLRGSWAVVLDVPLLYETQLDRFCGATVVVALRDQDEQLRRLVRRDAHLAREDALRRIESQDGVEAKAERCRARGGFALDNGGSREDLERQLAVEMQRVRGENPRWWAWLLLGCPPLALAVGVRRLWMNNRFEKAWEEKEKKEMKRL
ncbi:Dephospho-CoA kinase CAB5 [Escovopsis weberi]|uniref:Dephospho-CoA kinase CAB5 n=1 Tax=Escovopsis weberi TaxID=150374 RepID=A0A0M8N424_ESCWE|nr:Dephospho-CoA kinase CAB5 [Escovopsis weberi]